MAIKKKPTKKTTKKKAVVRVKNPEGGRLKKDVQKEILDYVVQLKLEGRDISCRDLAKKQDITPNTAARYIRKANLELLKIKPFDREEEAQELRMIHQRIKRRCLHWLDRVEANEANGIDDPKTDAIFLRETKDSIKEYTKFLEEWEFKEKIADKVDIEHNFNADRMREIYDEDKIIDV